MSFPVKKVLPNTIRFLVDVSIGQAAARIINIDQTEVLCGRFEQLQVVTRLYPKSTRCDVTLKYCGLSSPEGSIAQVSAYEAILVYEFLDADNGRCWAAICQTNATLSP
jgi:vacuolar protein sorting-associated protein 13A/C